MSDDVKNVKMEEVKVKVNPSQQEMGTGPEHPDIGPEHPDIGPEHPDIGPECPDIGLDCPVLPIPDMVIVELKELKEEIPQPKVAIPSNNKKPATSRSRSNAGPSGPCLFCLRNAPKEPKMFESGIVGASCVTLQKHLQIFFVVQKILDLPSSICEEILHSDQYPNVHYWLRICDQCFPSIENAWRLYQRILMAQTGINEIKEKLKRKITTTIETKPEPNKSKSKKVDLMKEFRKVVTSNDVEFTFEQIFKKKKNPKARAKGNSSSIPVRRKRASGDGNEESERNVMDDDSGNNDDNVEDGHDPEYSVHQDEDGDHDTSDPEWDLERSDNESRRKRSSSKVSRSSSSSAKSGRKKRYIRKFPWRCKICPAKFEEDGEGKFNDHMKAHERCESNGNQFACKKCKQPFDNDHDLEMHIARRHPKSAQREHERKCKLCSYTTYRRFKFEQHVRTVHPRQEEESGLLDELKCPICNMISGTVQALALHKRRMHSELFGQKAEPDSLFQCDECGQKFDNGFRLQHHKNIHDREKNPVTFNYFCEICGKGFKTKCRLREHMVIHSTVGAWMCSTCGLDFKFKHGLTKHRQAHHPEEIDSGLINPKFVRKGNEDVFECKICRMELPVAFRRRHMKTHLDPTKAFKCDQCDRMYFKLQALNKHKEINHSDGSHKVNCPFCNKEFIHQEYLKWHYRYCQVKKNMESSSTVEEKHPIFEPSEDSSNNDSISVPVITAVGELKLILNS